MSIQEKIDELAQKCHNRRIAFAIYFNGPNEWRISTYSTSDSECFATSDRNNIGDAIDDVLDFLFSINTRESINERLEKAGNTR